MEPGYPEYDTPESSGFGKSAALFFVTMGTVFGLGMIWTNHGETIAFKWRKDWHGMTESWGEATRRKPMEQKNNFGISGILPGHRWKQEFDQVNYELNSQRVRSNRRGVVPMIDTRKPRL